MAFFFKCWGINSAHFSLHRMLFLSSPSDDHSKQWIKSNLSVVGDYWTKCLRMQFCLFLEKGLRSVWLFLPRRFNFIAVQCSINRRCFPVGMLWAALEWMPWWHLRTGTNQVIWRWSGFKARSTLVTRVLRHKATEVKKSFPTHIVTYSRHRHIILIMHLHLS